MRVELQGELDLGTAEQLEDELGRVEAEGPELLVLDLRSLSFLDSTGLRVVASADARARDQGRRMVIVQGPPAVRRVFELTRLDEHLDVVEDPAAIDSGT
ncbi:MAG: STAS domain-containing protein [Thermoleophilia bacterium]|nr:STAS domain-containing protein [Thermoleophilia bacterium]